MSVNQVETVDEKVMPVNRAHVLAATSTDILVRRILMIKQSECGATVALQCARQNQRNA